MGRRAQRMWAGGAEDRLAGGAEDRLARRRGWAGGAEDGLVAQDGLAAQARLAIQARAGRAVGVCAHPPQTNYYLLGGGPDLPPPAKLHSALHSAYPFPPDELLPSGGGVPDPPHEIVLGVGGCTRFLVCAVRGEGVRAHQHGMVQRLVQLLAVVVGVAVALVGHDVVHLHSCQGGNFAQCTAQRWGNRRCRRQAGGGRRCAGCLSSPKMGSSAWPMCADGGIFFGGCPVAEPWCRGRNLSCCTDVTHEHSWLLASRPLKF
eukprot:scaffold84245_cov49-Phaeocystis_antarctica.AAC.1